MDEHIARTILRLNEAEALDRIEPLNGASGHDVSHSLVLLREKRSGASNQSWVSPEGSLEGSRKKFPANLSADDMVMTPGNGQYNSRNIIVIIIVY
jgi:hypothetical protein